MTAVIEVRPGRRLMSGHAASVAERLVDALRRVVDAADLLGCIRIVVDAKDADAEIFT
jgi:hypothetical protein